MRIIQSSDPNYTRNDLIWRGEAQEITFDLFEILLNFCLLLIFLEILKILKTPYWLRYSSFNVEDMRFTKEFRTYYC